MPQTPPGGVTPLPKKNGKTKKFGSVTCPESKYCRREVLRIIGNPILYTKHENGDNLHRYGSDDFIFTQKFDIDEIKFF